MTRRIRDRIATWHPAALTLAACLCVLTVLTRIPFRAEILHHWDSINFALALDHFDIRLHQPHPPGTFVIYIGLGRLINTVLHDANASLVWLSVGLSGLGVGALFLLSERWYDRRVALSVALLAIVSPLVWFHGEVALSYMLEFFWVQLVVYACYMMYTRRWGPLLISAFLLGMAGGIRPNTPVFLFPLWLGAVILHKYPFRRILLAGLAMAVGVLIWAVPMLLAAGGLADYIEIMGWWQAQHTEESASFYGLLENVIRFGVYLFYALLAALIPLALAAICYRRQIVRSLLKDWRAQTLALWILPATAYLAIVHLRQPGHTFTVLPAFLILGGLALTKLASRGVEFRSRLWLVGLSVVVIVNVLFFLAGPTYLFGDTRMLFTTPSRSAIRDYDLRISTRLQAIRDAFTSAETVVTARGRTLRVPDYYLQDFQYPLLSSMLERQPVTLSAPVNTLVFFDDEALPGTLPAGLELQTLTTGDGTPIHYLSWEQGQELELAWDGLEVHDR